MNNVSQPEDATLAERIVKHVLSHAEEGNPQSVVDTIDKYCYTQEWAMNIGDVKGKLMDTELLAVDPTTSIELGTYIGYSAVRIARLLKPGAHLYCLEISPDFAKLAKKVIKHAGLDDKITVIIQSSAVTIPQLRTSHGISKIDFALIDHDKKLYIEDLQAFLDCDLLRPGSVIFADNTGPLFPTSQSYLQYVRAHPNFTSRSHSSCIEYRPEQEDAVEISTFKL